MIGVYTEVRLQSRKKLISYGAPKHIYPKKSPCDCATVQRPDHSRVHNVHESNTCTCSKRMFPLDSALECWHETHAKDSESPDK